jgi:hypothetical protein
MCESHLPSLVTSGVFRKVSGNTSLPCKGCRLDKPIQLPYYASQIVYTRPFDLIHSDVRGPSPFVLREGHRYYMILIDDLSRFTWIYFIESQAQVVTPYQAFDMMVHTQFDSYIRVFHANSVEEYLSPSLHQFLSEQATTSPLELRSHPHLTATTSPRESTFIIFLDHVGLIDHCSVDTPMELHTHLRATYGVPLNDPTRYCHLVDSLVYLGITLLDISFDVHGLSQFMSTPTSVHYNHLLRVLQYLCGIIDRCLLFSSSISLQLHAYSDTTWRF